ncbi:hypothetical protein V8E36_003798 [Tilletia maclaganii]
MMTDDVAMPDPSQLQLVLRTPNHAAFYDRSSKIVTLHHSSDLGPLAGPSRPPLLQPARSNSLALLPHQPAGPLTTTAAGTPTLPTSAHACPTCLRPFSPSARDIPVPPPVRAQPHYRIPPAASNSITPVNEDELLQDSTDESHDQSFVAPNYFRLLASASVAPSRAPSRPSTPITTIFAEDEQSDDDFELERGAIGGVSMAESALSGPPRGFILNSTATGPSRPAPSIGIPGTPPRQAPSARASSSRQRLQASQFSQGYFDRFFVRVRKLGRGARGTVWLCQHVLGGQKLGEYAVKQVPVGDYADNLLASLKEVQMLETLRHPNIIHYQHAWIEEAQTSPFAPCVPTLHVLMMAANGGSLADWISARAGNPAPDEVLSPDTDTAHRFTASPKRPAATVQDHEDDTQGAAHISMGSYARHRLAGLDSVASSSGPPSPRMEAQKRENERLKSAIRQRRLQRQNADQASAHTPNRAGPSTSGSSPAGPPEPHAQHLLGEEELFSLLRDMASGLAWLHERGVLHLDVKPENVLLHWERADDLLPRAMLSDFGSSTFLQGNWRRIRSGHTGTMDFMAPEAIFPDKVTGILAELTSKSDVWSLGMVLHLCVFFRLPYVNSDDIDGLRAEMEAYRGFSSGDERSMHRAQVPPLLSMLLGRMLDRDPSHRPSCEEILAALASASPTLGSGAAADHFDTAAAPAPSAAAGSGALALLRRRPRRLDSGEFADATHSGWPDDAGLFLQLDQRRRVGASAALLRVLSSPEQRWLPLLLLAAMQSAGIQTAVARGAVGPGAAWLLALLVLIEVSIG